MNQLHYHSTRVWNFLVPGIIALASIILMIHFTGAIATGTSKQADTTLIVSLVGASEPFLVRDINPGITSSVPMFLTRLHDIFLFSADDGSVGGELWKSDGSLTGTVRIVDLQPGAEGSNPSFLYNYNGSIYFAARDTQAYFYRLLKSDGTISGTLAIPAYCSSPHSCNSNLWDPAGFTESGGKLFFDGIDTYGYTALFTTTGAMTETRLVQNFDSISDLVNLNNTLYFSAKYNEIDDQELWASDGTTAGTHIVSNINPTSNAYVSELTIFHDKIFFSAQTDISGLELWVSDGTSEGTVLVKDINPGSNGSGPTGFVVAGNSLFFSAFQETTGFELWKTDGTITGTVMVKDIYTDTALGSASPLIALNGKLLFAATDNRGRELWITDGTSEGTYLIKDINPGSASSDPGGFIPRTGVTRYSNLAFFQADNGSQGIELWRSDGTPDGTMLVKDINPGIPGSDPSNLIAGNNMLFFTADDGEHGQELWAMSFPLFRKVYLPLVGR